MTNLLHAFSLELNYVHMYMCTQNTHMYITCDAQKDKINLNKLHSNMVYLGMQFV